MEDEVENPKTLIVIPSFHLLEYVQKLIKTIKCKSSFEIMLIDNGSQDELTEEFKKIGENQEKLVFISEQNLGAAGGWNMGLYTAFETLNCDNVIILNNDTLLLADTIDRILEDLKQEGVGLATATNISGAVVDENEFTNLKLSGSDKYEEAPDFSCFGINRKCFETVGYFDEAFYPAYFEDNDYHYRMRLENLKAIKNLGNFYFHYGSRTKTQNIKFAEYIKWRFLKNGEYYIKKWGGDRGEEKYKEPFDGKPPGELKIQVFEDYKNEVEHLNLPNE